MNNNIDGDLLPFENRRDAGRQLALALIAYKSENPVILALPRGGVPVAYEVAKALDAPLDVLLVRKIGAPGFLELGLGAVAEMHADRPFLNQALIEQLQASPSYISDEIERQMARINVQRKLYSGNLPPAYLAMRTVIIIDDGIATGGTMHAAINAARDSDAKRIVCAVPVAPASTIDMLRGLADDVVCLASPDLFGAVGKHYQDFAQTSDDEVVHLLNEARRTQLGSIPRP